MPLDPSAATRPLAAPEPLVGSLVGGRYRVGKPIGKGGMGVVFHAEHVGTGRHVALKVLGHQWALHREARGRFVAEARATHRIEHPDVIGVLDAGETADGRPFIAMEYVDGESLLAEVRRGVPALARSLQIVRAIADVLVAAHAKGIVHRDLKCENVMILRSADADAPARIKLLDFGLAAALRDDPSARLTSPGIVMGTPGYMAPEQGRGAPATPLLDVYAVGVVLFELLTGKLPFGDTDPMMVIVTKMTSVAPSIATRRDDLPPALVQLVDDCLAREPEDRPADMVTVRSRLDAIVSPEPQRSVLRGRIRPRPLAVRLAIGASLLVALRLLAPRIAHGEEPAIEVTPAVANDPLPFAALAVVPDEPRRAVAEVSPLPPPPPVAAPAAARAPAHARNIDTLECARTRARALDARTAHDWDGVLRHVERRTCWGPMIERDRLRVLALAELGRFAECVAIGDRSRDAQVRRTVELCRRRR